MGVSPEIDKYLEAHPERVRLIFAELFAIVNRLAPDATLKLSYGMPTFFAPKVLVHFGAFKNHIGMYPPLRKPDELVARAAKYLNDKGNLAFPLSADMPFDLIEAIVVSRLANMQTSGAKKESSVSDISH